MTGRIPWGRVVLWDVHLGESGSRERLGLGGVRQGEAEGAEKAGERTTVV